MEPFGDVYYWGYSIISTGICILIPDKAPSQYPVLLDEVQGLLPKI